MSGNVLGCQGSVEKVLSWEPNCTLSVLCPWASHNPIPGLCFPNSLIRRLSPCSPGVLPAWLFCDSVSSGSEVSSWYEMRWGVMGSDEGKARDRASARHEFSPTFPDWEMGYESIYLA